MRPSVRHGAALKVVERNRRIIEDPEGPSEQVWTVPVTATVIRLMRLSALYQAHEALEVPDET